MAQKPRTPISIHPIHEPPAAVPVEGRRPEPAPERPPTSWRKSNTRLNRRGVAFYLPPEAFRQLGRLSVDLDRTIQSLMVEATDDLFAKHLLSRIASGEEEAA